MATGSKRSRELNVQRRLWNEIYCCRFCFYFPHYCCRSYLCCFLLPFLLVAFFTVAVLPFPTYRVRDIKIKCSKPDNRLIQLLLVQNKSAEVLKDASQYTMKESSMPNL